MTRIKALFFDIDGTLVSFTTHRIPQSTVDALAAAKSRGVKVFISTGRPPSFIINLGQIAHLVDGYITTNGAYSYIGDEVVAKHCIGEAQANAIIGYCDDHGEAAVVVGTRDVTAVNVNGVLRDLFVDQLGVTTIKWEMPLADVLAQGILQISPFLDKQKEDEALAGLDVTSGRWHPAFTDVTASGISKGSALSTMARRLGLATDECMAFGDGGNDISIIRAAGVGVAMGNATDDVKAAADHVTTSVDDDGIANALRQYGVI